MPHSQAFPPFEQPLILPLLLDISLTNASLSKDRNAGDVALRLCDNASWQHRGFRAPLFSGLSLLRPEFQDEGSSPKPALSATVPRVMDSALVRNRLEEALQSPTPRVPPPWSFRGNGGRGVKTWLSEGHILEINPHWLGFEMFDSMDLNMTDAPPGPGEMEPQEWRSTFTVGLSTDWQVTRAMAFSAGYRFYNNPMPEDITAGAFPNANQHVLAVGIRVQQGRHSVALVYGLDMLEGATAQITSARQNGNVDEMGHLVSFNYGFSF